MSKIVILLLIYAAINFFIKNIYNKNENVRKYCSEIAKTKILFYIFPVLWIILFNLLIFAPENYNLKGIFALVTIGITVLTALIEVFIQSIAASHFEKGNTYDEEEKYAEAIEEYNKAIDLMKFNIPQKDLYLNNKAISLLRIEKYSEAVECLKQAISINKRNSLYYENLGYAYFLDNKYKSAEINYETAVKKDKKDLDNKLYLCVIKNALGKKKIAFYIFRDIIITLKKDKSINDKETFYNFIDILVNFKKEKEAEQFCELASKFKYNLYLHLGNYYYDESNYDKAFEYYKKALELSPKNADIYNNIGSVKSLNGNYEESIPYIEKAIDLSPNNPMYYNNIAFSYFMIGEYLTAEKYYESAGEIKKDEYDSKYYIFTKLALNKDDEAQNILIKYIEQLTKNKYTYNEILDNFGNTIKYLIEKNKLNECIKFCEIAQKSGFVLYNYIGDYYYEKLDYNKAVEYCTKQLEYEQKAYLYSNRAYAKGCIKDFNGAIEDFNKAIELEPNEHRHYIDLASAYFRNGNYDLAEKTFEKVKSMNIDIYENIYCIIKLMLNKEDEAENIFKKFINDYKPKNGTQNTIKEELYSTIDYIFNNNNILEIDKFCELALKFGFVLYNYVGNSFYIEKSNYEKAIEYYTKHIEYEPEYYWAYYNRGCSKNCLKDYKSAIEDFNKALDLNPEGADSYYERGVAKSWLDDFEGAIEDYNKAIELNSYNSNYYYARGNAKNGLKDYTGAIEDYNKSITLNPKNAGPYLEKALLYKYLEDYDNAIKTYTDLINIEPENVTACIERAACYSRLKQQSHAIKDLDKAVEINSSNPYPYWVRASFYFYYADNYAMALNDCNYAINLIKNNKDSMKDETNYLYAFKSRILFDKDKNRALDFLIEIENNCPNENKDKLYIALSYVFFSLENYKKALKYANLAILKNKENGTAYYRKKCALEAMGKHDEAREFFEKAAKLGYREDF